MFNVSDNFGPCSAFFSSGRNVAGSFALCMQATGVFWPVASKWAKSFREQQEIESYLSVLSDQYAMPAARDADHRGFACVAHS